jgi:hypothetical protein
MCLEGRLPRGEAVGEHGLEVALAWRFGWTPAQVREMDPNYIEEVMARLEAEGQIAEQARQEQERERKRIERERRRAEREARGGMRGTAVELSEIP